MISSHGFLKKFCILTNSIVNSFFCSNKLFMCNIFSVFIFACTMSWVDSLLTRSNFFHIMLSTSQIFSDLINIFNYFMNLISLFSLSDFNLFYFNIQKFCFFNCSFSIFPLSQKLFDKCFTEFTILSSLRDKFCIISCIHLSNLSILLALFYEWLHFIKTFFMLLDC